LVRVSKKQDLGLRLLAISGLKGEHQMDYEGFIMMMPEGVHSLMTGDSYK